MKFTELSDYPIPAGTLTVWTPAAAATSWREDPRPFTHDQVALAQRSTAERSDIDNCWLGAVFEISDTFDADLVRRTLRHWLARHEAFGSTFDLTAPEPLSVRRTCRGGAIDVDGEVVGTFVSGDEVSRALTEIFGGRLAPTRWPHCLVATIESAPVTGSAAFTVVFAADHMVMDAYSIMLCINEIRTIHRALADDLRVELPTVGSHLDFCAHDRAVGQSLAVDHPAVTGWRDFLYRAEEYPDFSLPLMRPHLETGDHSAPLPQHGLSEYVADDHEATHLGAVARAAGHSTQTAVFAALAVAHHLCSGTDVLRVIMPMHTRHEARYAGSVGWYVGLAPLEIDLSAASTFDDALDATAAGIDAVRHLPAFPYQRVAELLEVSVEPEFVVSYLDVRHVPGSDGWADARAQILRGTSRSDREVYLWIARVPDGITLSARYPGHDPAEESLRTFVDTYSTILRTVASSGASLPVETYTRTTFTGGSTFDDARPA